MATAPCGGKFSCQDGVWRCTSRADSHSPSTTNMLFQQLLLEIIMCCFSSMVVYKILMIYRPKKVEMATE